MIIFELISIAWGFAWHQFGNITAEINEKHPGWSQLTNYTVGVVITAPVFAIALKKTGRFTPEQIFTASCIFMFSFLLIGLGTALGWLVSPTLRKE